MTYRLTDLTDMRGTLDTSQYAVGSHAVVSGLSPAFDGEVTPEVTEEPVKVVPEPEPEVVPEPEPVNEPEAPKRARTNSRRNQS